MNNSAAVPSPAVITEQEQKIFKTSLFGFKRDDVLMYVERLNRESGEAAFALRQSIEQLENGLKAKSAENTVLTEKAQELEAALNFEKQRAYDAEQLVNNLRLEADRASDEAASYKSRLFAKEQEAVVLKADNSRLNQAIEQLTEQVTRYEAAKEAFEKEKADALAQAQAAAEQAQLGSQQIIENARFEAESILEQAGAVKASAELEASAAINKVESETKLIRSKASNDAVALVSAAEKEKLAAKQLVSSSAQSIANSIIILKAEIESVDSRIAAAVSELTRLTGGISGALSETEKSLQTLGVQMESFPEPSRPVSPARPARTAPKRKTTSEFLLEKLARLLK